MVGAEANEVCPLALERRKLRGYLDDVRGLSHILYASVRYRQDIRLFCCRDTSVSFQSCSMGQWYSTALERVSKPLRSSAVSTENLLPNPMLVPSIGATVYYVEERAHA